MLILTSWPVFLLDPLYNLHKDKPKKELQEPPSTRIKFQHRLKIVKNIFDFFHQHSYLSMGSDDPCDECISYKFYSDVLWEADKSHIVYKQSILLFHTHSFPLNAYRKNRYDFEVRPPLQDHSIRL